MKGTPSSETLPGSRIQCREADGQLVLYLPNRPRRVLKRIAGTILPLAAVAVFVYVSWGEVPPLWALTGLIVVLAIILPLIFGNLVVENLTKGFVVLTPDSLVVKTVLLGKEKTRQYALIEKSRASGGPLGIEIKTADHKVQFGVGLSPGERDWVKRRINRFLGRAADADAPAIPMATGRASVGPIEGVPEKPIPRPTDTKIRIDENYFTTRIHIPGALQMHTLWGINHVIFGLGLATCFLYLIVQWQKNRHPDSGALIMYGLFALLGLMSLLSGLTRLFGSARLTINRERITYRVGLFGIGPWQRLRTADVLSVRGCVIRTATRKLCFGEWLQSDDQERQWVAGEVARRIEEKKGTSLIVGGKA